MAIRKRQCTWWVDIRYDNTRYRKRSPLNTRKGAIEYERTLRSMLARGEAVYLARDARIGLTEKRPTFEGFAHHWLDTYVRTNLRASTQGAYRQSIEEVWLPEIGSLDVRQVGTQLIEDWKGRRAARGNSPKTINNHLSVLRKCLTTAHETELLEKMPRIRWLRVPPASFDFLSPRESAGLIASAPKPLKLLVLCALRTGMRAGELIGLRWEDINLDRRIITVRRSVVRGIEDAPKGNRIRHLPISDDLHAALSAVAQTEGRVLSGARGLPLRHGSAFKGLRRTAEAASLRPIGLHVLRHTFASQLASEGVSLFLIKALLGHRTIDMTLRYAHLAPSSFENEVNLLEAAERREQA